MRYNVPKSCATRSCCACVDLITCVAERYLTLRTGCEKHGRKNPLPFPFSQRSHVGNLRQTIQGKGEIHKRVENRRLSTLLCAPPRRRVPFASQAPSSLIKPIKQIKIYNIVPFCNIVSYNGIIYSFDNLICGLFVIIAKCDNRKTAEFYIFIKEFFF